MVWWSKKSLSCLFLCFICNSAGDWNEVSRNTGSVVIPRRVNNAGKHISYGIPRIFKRQHHADLERLKDEVHYIVPIAGEDHHLELKANHKILGPGVIVETYDTNRGLKGTQLKRFSDNQCQFNGRVRGDMGSRVSVSTCNGLSGYIRMKRGYFVIEPLGPHEHLSGKPQPHILSTYNGSSLVNPNCGVSGSENNIPVSKKSIPNSVFMENNTEAPKELHIETLVVLDRSFLNYHKEIDVENFVLTVFNMAHDLYHDRSLGTNINLAIVRLIRLESEDHEMNIALNRNPSKTLDYFRKWQDKVNPKDDAHPNHHDVAILITRIDICGDDRTCGFLGTARIAGVCNPENQAVICQDNGLTLGLTIAHEIGHALGLHHDSTSAESDYRSTVMSPFISSKIVQWSNCSKHKLLEIIDSGSKECLYDAPTDHSFELVDTLPGVMYDADFQCREILGPNAALCMTGVECKNLICYVEDKGCVESHIEAAQGTSCGQNKWCFHAECVEVGERPGAIDGGWGPWTEWSDCSRTCGSGVASKERHCNDPLPSLGGKYCEGLHKMYRICSTEPCDVEDPTFRDLQCAEFNTWLYPEDEKLHQWKSYPVHDENPCALYCINEVGIIATLRPRVIDGTACYHGIRNICINGLCKEIPCDLNLQSNAVEDRCGVCKGDGTSCNVVRGEKLFTCSYGIGERYFMEIPKGAVNIKIEELIPTESRIELRDAGGQNVFITGDTVGLFSVPGSKAWVGMIRTKQEAFSIPGPITKPLSLWVGVQQNTTIKFSYATNATKKSKPVFSWDYLEWSRCSSECGLGTQESIPKCVEKSSGQVDEMYCKNLTKPTEQIRTCEVAPCIPKWYVSDWSDCSKCPKGVRSRIVKCFKPVGNGEGEMSFVPDSNCVGTKPRVSESCTCKNNTNSDRQHNGITIKGIGNSSDIIFSPNSTVLDFESLEDVKLTIHTELEGDKYPLGLPHPKKSNSSVYDMDGKEAMKFLNVLQQDFSNNKTKI